MFYLLFVLVVCLTALELNVVVGSQSQMSFELL